MEPAAAHEVATRLPVTVHERGVVTVVGVGGELDAWTAPALCERIEECLQAGAPSLLLDLSELQACDEPALRALAGAVHEARAHEARVRVLRPSLPDVARAFDGAHGVPLAADADQALRELA
jgi:anti-anti-sigma factor